jgi:zona occludens toxin
MLHLITGANGAGKTLNALKWVRERSLKESRPVCHNGRFKPVEGGELSTWKQIDIKNWQDEPDGTIFLVDECHNDFPVRPPSGTPPDYVRMLAEHRRRGMDFYLITQHPQNIDSFVRRLIGSPGWHRHLKRTFGANLVSVLEWAAVNPNCEKDGSGRSAEVSTVPFPSEVFKWYESASLHTGKPKMPKKVWVFIFALLGALALFGFAFSSVLSKGKKAEDEAKTSQAKAEVSAPASREDTTTTEYFLKQRAPRLPDFPHTAPAYDEVTKPVRAPYPAACITMRNDCRCYTQQGTLLQTSNATCMAIVNHGFFVDWETREESDQDQRNQPGAHTSQPLTVHDAHRPDPLPREMPVPGYSERLAARNASVQSIIR